MPGWWYTVESTTTTHVLKQFKEAIREAMSATTETRALMRARSAKQRFPVAQWVEDLEILQSTSIRIHDKAAAEKKHSSKNSTVGFGLGISTPKTSYSPADSGTTTPHFSRSRANSIDDGQLGISTPRISFAPASTFVAHSGTSSPQFYRSRANSIDETDEGTSTAKFSFSPPSRFDVVRSRTSSPQLSHSSANSVGKAQFEHTPDVPRLAGPGLSRKVSLGSRRGPGHIRTNDYNDGTPDRSLNATQQYLPPIADVDESAIGRAISVYLDNNNDDASSLYSFSGDEDECTPPMAKPTSARGRQWDRDSSVWPLHSPLTGTISSPPTPDASTGLFPPPRIFSPSGGRSSPTPSMLSVDLVVGENTDFKLQKVDPFFTDGTGMFYHEFEHKLETLNGKNSESTNCIEMYLVEAEKSWFNSFRNAKLGRLKNDPYSHSARSSFQSRSVSARNLATGAEGEFEMHSDDERDSGSLEDEFLLGKDYKPPTGISNWLSIRVGDWPVYAFLIALGQIMAANSYQITLLTGEVGQTASKLYVVASIYLATSICWWILFRRFPAVVSLSLPFFFYGLAFILIGLAPYSSGSGRAWIQNMGTAFYAVASSSGALFFALNFGDEGGAQIKAWVFRACVIQGTQQIYVVALWFWGTALSTRNQEGIVTSTGSVLGTWKITAITFPIAIAVWTVGALLWFGLPKYYRQTPGKMPSFYKSALKRKVILWFFVTVVIQNFFLGAPYGRNWAFLFSSQHAQTWQVLLLAILFFVGVWAGFLAVFGYLSMSHSWILPLFAIGLGAPRWAQIWWGTSNIGLYLPWAGSYVSGALVSRALWLWLGVLDAVQGVGLGMIMLGTLTRVHVAFAVTACQVLGSISTIVGRAVAPNKIGPGPISPDISGGVSAIWQAWFWVGLMANLLICLGFYKFFRKEQLQKP